MHFFSAKVEYMNNSLRLDILEANFFVHKVSFSAFAGSLNTLL